MAPARWAAAAAPPRAARLPTPRRRPARPGPGGTRSASASRLSFAAAGTQAGAGLRADTESIVLGECGCGGGWGGAASPRTPPVAGAFAVAGEAGYAGGTGCSSGGAAEVRIPGLARRRRRWRWREGGRWRWVGWGGEGGGRGERRGRAGEARRKGRRWGGGWRTDGRLMGGRVPDARAITDARVITDVRVISSTPAAP